MTLECWHSSDDYENILEHCERGEENGNHVDIVSMNILRQQKMRVTMASESTLAKVEMPAVSIEIRCDQGAATSPGAT